MILHDLRAIGERLFTIRKKSGKTQLEVAAEAEISDRTYSELERGITDVRISTVLKTCEALRITPDDILTDHSARTAALEADVLARLQTCTPQQKLTALQLLDVYLRSVE